MRSPPADLARDHLLQALASGWGLRPAAVRHVPKGGGSFHWRVTDESGRRYFVTVDDLDDRDWLGDDRESVFEGLAAAFATAAALQREAGLEFVVAPVAGRDGALLRRIDARYAASVFPFLDGRSYRFGSYPDSRLQASALAMIAALHASTGVVRARAPGHFPDFGGRGDLSAFLLDPDRRWDGGPFAEDAHRLLAPRRAEIAELSVGFDELVEATTAARSVPVITHGEPHPGNLMAVDRRVVMIDWDTVALAPAERDVSVIAAAGDDIAERYQEATGRQLDPAVLTLYRLRWYLDDLASAVRLFRNRHRDTADTRRWRDGLGPRLECLPEWLDRLA